MFPQTGLQKYKLFLILQVFYRNLFQMPCNMSETTIRIDTILADPSAYLVARYGMLPDR